jgi:phosphatidylinositol-3,4,5-trisphosphate 5-phosphatase 1
VHPHAHEKLSFGVFAHEHVFFIGDLNYRLDVVEYGLDTVYTKIAAREYAWLLAHDQLCKAKKSGDAFVGFQVGAIA